jgi:hypothetical protein
VDNNNGWRKASYSNGQGDCVEVGHVSGAIGVRDTKQDGRGPVLAFSADSWGRFLSGLKSRG